MDLRARLYDPVAGRFLQRDGFAGVAGVPQSLNRYSYAHNNPANLTDPSGHAVPLVFGAYLVAAWAVAELGLTAADG